MSNLHRLKTSPIYFQQIKAGSKTFECRKNDRDFKEGDFLLLKEWDEGTTGQEIVCKVTSILYDYQFKGVANNHCIMSILVIQNF